MTAPQPAPQITRIAPADIDATALPRDRTALDPTALDELRTSILIDGLRQPIEVFALATDGPHHPGPRYGLISGYRRLTVFRDLAPSPDHAHIPAFIRTPRDGADAMAQMIAENEIRAQITPWEKGRIVVEAVEHGLFDTLDAATDGLFRGLDRHRRARIRTIADVVATLGGHALAAPEQLSQNQLTRLAFALRTGFEDVVEGALRHAADRSPAGQWALLLPIIEEAEAEARSPAPAALYRPGRPRRIVQPRAGLTIRRERTADGWTLRFTGPDATGPLMEDIMDHVERDFGIR